MLTERDSLVCGRIREIRENPETDSPEQQAFFRACAQTALGETADEDGNEFLDYSVCRRCFGKESAPFWCLLYAQLKLAVCVPAEWKKTDSLKELAVASRELFTELYGMMLQGDPPEYLRDTLYWFFSDYSALLAAWQYACIEEEEVTAGGPMLLLPKRLPETDPAWTAHTADAGLYLGNRFAERFLAGLKQMEKTETRTTVFRTEFSRCLCGLTQAPCGGFGLTGHQKQVLEGIRTRI